MALWIPVTIAAALAQTIRFMLQKQLKSAGLSTSGAAFSRFVFGMPIAVVVSVLAIWWTGEPVPVTSGRFWAYALTGGLAQIVATHLTVALLSLRNFAVGIAFTKTETVQVALLSIVLLRETIAPSGWIAIAIGMAGVFFLSRPVRGREISSRTTLYGLWAGGLFALSVVCYRAASLELGDGPAFVRATVALACVTLAQTIGMGLWMRAFEAGELTRVFAFWRRTVWVGVAGAVGSLFWFFAFALASAAYVRALGQIEMVFTLMVSVTVFRERLTGEHEELWGVHAAWSASSSVSWLSFAMPGYQCRNVSRREPSRVRVRI